MGLNLETAIAWMRARKGQVSYSMDDRNGPDSYDCSSSIYYALLSGGAVSAGWAVNTEYEHDWLKKNGYELIAENTPWDAQRGDIFIWGAVDILAGQVAILVFSWIVITLSTVTIVLMASQ
ncbi:bacteriophage peptidoglycan hydrolase family protein [Streptococcus oralis]|nr:bacteriophage peptidoglycan hydrolase family protein [Streptococcus oralis]